VEIILSEGDMTFVEFLNENIGVIGAIIFATVVLWKVFGDGSV